MKKSKRVRYSLGLKFFLSYLAVIGIGIVVLITAANIAVPSAFNKHMTTMDMMGNSMMENMNLFVNFKAALTQTMVIAGLAAIIVAVIISLFISQKLVVPIQKMKNASHRIAEGNYNERVNIPGRSHQGEVDELGQLAISFNQMAENLEKTETLRRQLIGDVAHELRTPLTTIKGSMEGLIDGVLPSEIETFQQIYSEADRLQRLVHDLQELSRVEAGVFEMKPKPILVSELIDNVLHRLDLQFKEKGITIKANLSENLPKVLVDKDRITQVLINLIGNALQYTPSGGNVIIGQYIEGEMVFITISDTGVGIQTEQLSQVFDRFYRVDKSRSRAGGGSGIGLTIAKHLVEANGGNIWVQSLGQDHGSKFTFSLPIA
ncbi:MAG: cell wall metabolism sensor histidine kinase WalK [Chloroflexota bacterium]